MTLTLKTPDVTVPGYMQIPLAVHHLIPGNLISNWPGDDSQPTHQVESWDGSNLTLVILATNETYTEHLVDYLTKVVLHVETTYEAQVQAAIQVGQADIRPYFTRECPECGLAATAEDHTIVNGWVIVGCEGYHIVNPNLVGMDRPQWEDWTAPTAR